MKSSLAEQLAGDDDAHDLVGAFVDLVDAQVADHALHGLVLQVAVAAVRLEAVGWAFQPILRSWAPNDRPGAPFSTTKVETPLAPEPGSPVRAMTT